ncbi:ABC transporter permease, partial [Streptomyces sp. 7-21]|uniref:ABC transporter permease n=1 Tax=Streptomyces sp. 7-21 TaxID=2802283 RepID=UPI0019202E13
MTVLKTSLRSFFSHKARMLLSGLAIALSVSFVSGTLVFSDTLNTTFDRFFDAVAADVTISPAEDDNAQETGRGATLPASLVERVRDVEGVAAADGTVVNEQLTLVGADGDTLDASGPVFGGDWGPAVQRVMDLSEGREPAGPGEALLDSDTAETNEVAIGDEIDLITVDGRETVEITGLASFRDTNPGAAYLLLEPAAARTTLLGAPDVVSEIHIQAEDGVSDDALKRRIEEADLAAGVPLEVDTRQETTSAMSAETGFLDVIRYGMLGFAAIAVLVGIFLIVNTFSMLVAQRTREIGLMRAIGANRRQTARTVLTEALLLGLTGSAAGVVAGIGLAMGLIELMNSAGVNIDSSQVTVKAATPVAGLATGVLATLLAAWLPARRAGRVSPMAALREAASGGAAHGEGRTGRVRAALGLLLTGAGAAALVAAAAAEDTADGAPFLGLGLLLTLAGAIVVGPLLAAVVVRLLNAVVLRGFGSVGRMAGRNALRNPRRTGATAGALMIGLALVGALSVVATSVVASASDQLDRTVGADFIIEPSSGGLITPQAAQAVAGTPGLEHVTEYTAVSVEITTPDGETEQEDVIAADPTYAEDLVTPTVAGEQAAAYEPDQISVGESFAERHGLEIGDELSVSFTGGDTATLTLGAITSEDTLLDQGAMYMSLDTARSYLPADQVPLNVVMFAKAEEGQQDAAQAALEDALAAFPQLEVHDQDSYKQLLEDEIGAALN